MQDRQVHVAAQRVDQVVATDRQHVAVAGDDPHVEVGARQRDAGGDRRRAAVDAVHAVGVHVVREAAAHPMPDTNTVFSGFTPSSGMSSCIAARIE